MKREILNPATRVKRAIIVNCLIPNMSVRHARRTQQPKMIPIIKLIRPNRQQLQDAIVTMVIFPMVRVMPAYRYLYVMVLCITLQRTNAVITRLLVSTNVATAGLVKSVKVVPVSVVMLSRVVQNSIMIAAVKHAIKDIHLGTVVVSCAK